ncbi:hypothetical protein ACPPVT_02745 [Angustibacter sp. McL0619]|uniref:hypothetical protein n=1 Tax=Angustibacter sp. McL0619 TaxID=3415676 RepID=UPI003CF4E862
MPAETSTHEEPVAASTSRWRRVVLRLGRLQPHGNPSGLVYGMIVASVVITASTQYENSYPYIIGATALTVAVYWLTHVYCHLLGEAMSGSTRRIQWRSARPTFVAESTVLWGGGIELAAVSIALAFGENAHSSDWVAIVTSIVLLFCWGLLSGVRNGVRSRLVLLDALLGASLGALVALLKLLLK